jgi:hypothetical protein
MNSAIPMPIPREELRDRKFFVAKVGAALGKTVEGIIEAGRWLIAAKEKLPHGEFTPMVEDDLKMDASKAERLMTIASDPVIANPAHVRHLPAAWSTLYELKQLPPGRLEAAIEDGTVTPEIQRWQAIALRTTETATDMDARPEKVDGRHNPRPKGSVMSLIDRELKANPRRLDADIATLLDVGNSHVSQRRRRLEATGQIEIVPRKARAQTNISQRTLRKQLRSFDRMVHWIEHTCGLAVESQIPPISAEQKKSALKSLKEAAGQLAEYRKRIKEKATS